MTTKPTPASQPSPAPGVTVFSRERGDSIDSQTRTTVREMAIAWKQRGHVVTPDPVQPSPARSDKDVERAAFEAWALAERVAYKDEQYGLCFYDAGSGAHQWIGWQARAGQAQERATSSESIDHDAFWVLVAHCRDAKPGEDYQGKSAALVAYVNQWAARRATAGTTAAPSVKDHVLREVVNGLRDAAIKYHATSQLRERLRAELSPLLASNTATAAPSDLIYQKHLGGGVWSTESKEEYSLHDPDGESVWQVVVLASNAGVAAPGDLPRWHKEFADMEADVEGEWVKWDDVAVFLASNTSASPSTSPVDTDQAS